MRKCTAILLLIALLLSLSACSTLVMPRLTVETTTESTARPTEPQTTAPQPETVSPSDAAGILARSAENLKAVSGSAVHMALDLAAAGEAATISLDGEMMFFPFAMRLQMQLEQDDNRNHRNDVELYFRDAEDGAALYYCTKEQIGGYELEGFYERIPIKEAGLGTAVGTLFEALFDADAAWELEETDSAYILRTVVDLNGEDFSALRAGAAAQPTQLSVGGLPAFPQVGDVKFDVTVEIDREQLLLHRVSLDFTEYVAKAMKSVGNVERAVFSVELSDYNSIDQVQRPTSWMDRPVKGLSFETKKDAKAEPDQVDELTVRTGEQSLKIRLSAVSAREFKNSGWYSTQLRRNGIGSPWKTSLHPFSGVGSKQNESVQSAVILFADEYEECTYDEADAILSTGVFISSIQDLYAGTLDENVFFESPAGIRTGMTAEEAIQILGEPSGSFDEELFVCHAWANEKTALMLYFFPENGLFAINRTQMNGESMLPFLRN